MPNTGSTFSSAAGALALLAAMTSMPGAALAQTPAPDEAQAIAEEAYIYLYPLITMDVTRKQMINSDPAKSPIGAPANTFHHVRAFPTADMKAVVRPNFDTLYSSAWLDLTGGPVIVSTEDTGGRYFLLPMLDMWTDVFAVPGQRTNGTGAAAFAIVPPGWTGTLPDNIGRIDAPTPQAWLIGRTLTRGPKDFDAVHKVQDGYKITLLDDWGKTPRAITARIDPSVDTKTPPLETVNGMPAVDYFTYGAELMKISPPHETDWSTIARLKRIGLEPGKSFDAGKVDPAILTKAVADALKLMKERAPTMARVANGWSMNTDTMGVYGNYYLKRAIVAMAGLGANQVDDAIYPLNVSDADGKPVTGDNKYVLHFTKDELPPAEAFWSLTMYDAEGFQVANALNRFAIGSLSELTYNPDGSLDLYMQHASPGADKEANWLPAPASGNTGITLRLYAPRPQVANGQWNPPPIKKVD